MDELLELFKKENEVKNSANMALSLLEEEDQTNSEKLAEVQEEFMRAE